ncbi:RNA 3'-terminal phosphate cyclase [Glaciecola sp. MH2013]|uniref:RNA 3'-terminal phosphate cyclase n=1 Tax=Glaciecola sp. MH2013 TaxID=2785524 RepID=UPI0018A05604|nr:RNA 3'-terminal phosphate cyclase [Glaciecola sp. MH2013]MBF7073548.1 RNA 3'-terminal phosphate cyclase [Glaciecola sp. MH2013]
MDYMIIDGAQGEGGGQVLRTALTLSMFTQQNIELVNIRAGRKKPGLLRQHLTSVLAAQEVSDAITEGVELGATRIRFSPRTVKPGNYRFAIGSAGSTTLVCQTILPVLSLAKESSTVVFEGGTHNGMSPSLSFFEQSYLPLIKGMGVNCRVSTSKLGFYPAGGGKWQLNVKPSVTLKPFFLSDSGGDFANDIDNCSLDALVSLLPVSIGQREIATAQKLLGWQNALNQVHQIDSPGPGNSFQLSIQSQTHRSIFEVVGEHGLSSEKVAKRAVGRVNKFIHAKAAVEEYLADQLLILIAIAGSGSFTTTKPSLHTTTNIAVIKQILGCNIEITQVNDMLWKVNL